MPKEKSQPSLIGRLFRFIWRVVRTVIATFFLFVGLFIVITVYQTFQSESQGCDELSTPISGTDDFFHSRSWKSLKGSNRYCLHYSSQASIEKEFADLRDEMTVPLEYYETDEGYWGYIYQELLKDNDQAVDYIADSLLNIAQERSLDRSGIADMMVTFVQDIPYVLITNKPCEEDYQGPCRENEHYGILSPYEFLYSLEGDCDTRSVLLYALLSKAGFHPIIVVSEEYAHAMIALDVPATGDYIEYKHQRFYFWETTSHGWKPGMLPPSTNNAEYWKIALAHEF